jgi:hypothetical protein
MQVWRQALIEEWITWCTTHINRGGTITDYIPAPYVTWGFVISRIDLGAPPHRLIPKGTIRYNGADPATSPLYQPDGLIWLPDGPINPATEPGPPVPVFNDVEVWNLPGYGDLVPRP